MDPAPPAALPDLTTEELASALHGTLPRHDRVAAREALRMLIDHDGHLWLRDEPFLRRAVAFDDDRRPCFTRRALISLGVAVRRDEPWVHAHGPVAYGVLWLACELAASNLGALSDHADPATCLLIRSVIAEVFDPSPVRASSAGRRDSALEGVE